MLHEMQNKQFDAGSTLYEKSLKPKNIWGKLWLTISLWNESG